MKPAIPIQTQTAPGTSPDPQANPSAIPGQISLQEALKGGDGAKMDTISLGRPGDTATPGNQVGLGSLIEGKLTLEMLDTILPAIMVLVFHAAKIQLNKSVFQLAVKEKDTLAPLLQKCLDSIMINFNSPWTAFGVTAIAIYGAKIFEHGGKALIDRKLEEKKNKQPGKVVDMKQPVAREKEKEEPPKTTEPPTSLRMWDEDDVKKVIKKRRKGVDDAMQWLAANWEKKGGVI